MKQKITRYKGKSIRVTFDVELCTHVAECLRGLPKVFNTFRRPWIRPDLAEADEVARVIEKCPTGALQYSRLDGGPEEAVPEENIIRILPNGPYYFHGNVELQDETGNPFARGLRFALCRCGATQNAPACDNSHFRIMFSAPVTLQGTESSGKNPKRAALLSVKMQPQGPLRLTGPVTLITEDGTRQQREGRTLLCSCGLSKNKPFCDGSHANRK